MGKRKVFVIGPIVPGGIPQSNTVLCDNLAKNNEVTAISYSMMFPKIFYPGKKQRDGPYLKNMKFKQEFILNTLNPISWLKILNKVRKERPAWVVFQWWHVYFFPSYFFISFFAKHFFHAKINVCCVHILPYESTKKSMEIIHKPLTKLFLSSANHLATLSRSEFAILKKLIPNCNADFILENSFSLLMKPAMPKAKAQKILQLPNKKILLFFGAVRPYKGLDDLLEALSILLKKRKDLFLVAAGAFWEPVSRYEQLASSLGIRDSVKFVDKYVPDEEIPIFFCACDLVVLSHRTASQSGIPQLALEYNKPIVATDAGGNAVYIDEGKNGFIVPPADPKKLAGAIEKFFARKSEEDFSKYCALKKKEFDWTPEKEKKFFGEK